MALSPNIGNLSKDTIALTKTLLREVERLDTSTREVSPEYLIELTREIGERAHRIHLLSSSIRIATKQMVRRRKKNAPRKPKGFQWPVNVETGAPGRSTQEGGR